MDGWIDRSFASFIVTPRRASDRETERQGRRVIWTVRRAPASRVVDPRVASRVVRPRSRLTDENSKNDGRFARTFPGDGDAYDAYDGEEPVVDEELERRRARGVTPSQARSKFRDFLRNFRSAPDANATDGRYSYRDALDQSTTPRALTVCFDDLIAHDAELAREMREKPNEYLPIMEEAVADVVESFTPNEALTNGEEPDAGGALIAEEEDRRRGRRDRANVQVKLTSKEIPRALRSLNSNDVGKLVYVPGIVIATSKARTKAKNMVLECQKCGNTVSLQLGSGYSGANVPRQCTANMGREVGQEANPCGMDPFRIVPQKSSFIDQQNMKLQENPECVPAGEMPRNMTVLAERTMVLSVVPGTRVKIMGVYETTGGGGSSKRDRGGGQVAVQHAYIRVVGIDEETEGARGDAHFTDAEHTEFKTFAHRPFKEVIKDLRSRIAPAIYGSDDVKAAVACLLFSGTRKQHPDGTARRGDVNVLLIGDPSTAKSQFLKFVERTAPVCVYTSGKGSSAAGLTASVIRGSDNEFYLEGGAMVLADGGCVCIDEFDKMRDEDRVAIHEAMEQQTISIAKAGITTMLNSRTAVLAAANPPSGRYDDLKSAQENIDLQTTILSRFDMIFIVRDERLYERDMQIADHVLNIHAGGGDELAIVSDPQQEKERQFLKRYIEYARAMCRPHIGERAMQMLEDSYVKYRQEVRERKRTGGHAAVPITVRQLEAIVRISESLAKMCLQTTVTEEHVQEALRLFEVSTIDAARSGVADMVVLSAEQREELEVVETQIKQKIAIGATMSKRHLIDDLSRVGVNEWAVTRALLVMTQRGDVVERAEGRRVTRMH